jgi:hypothetical protein
VGVFSNLALSRVGQARSRRRLSWCSRVAGFTSFRCVGAGRLSVLSFPAHIESVKAHTRAYLLEKQGDSASRLLNFRGQSGVFRDRCRGVIRDVDAPNSRRAGSTAFADLALGAGTGSAPPAFKKAMTCFIHLDTWPCVTG